MAVMAAAAEEEEEEAAAAAVSGGDGCGGGGQMGVYGTWGLPSPRCHPLPMCRPSRRP